MSRPVSLPKTVHAEVFRLHGAGVGCRRIVRRLERMGVWTTKSSVHRLLRGHPPYQNELDQLPLHDNPHQAY